MWMRVCMCLSCLNLFVCVYECVCLCVHVHVCMCVGMTYVCMSMHILLYMAFVVCTSVKF